MAQGIRDGLIPELYLQQRKVKKMSEAQRCSILKYVRPTIEGFQCLHHCQSADTKVMELEDTGIGIEISAMEVRGRNFTKDLVKSQSVASCIITHDTMQEFRKNMSPSLSKCLQMRPISDGRALCTQRAHFPTSFTQEVIDAHKANFIETSRWSFLQNWSDRVDVKSVSHNMTLRRIPKAQREAAEKALTSVQKSGYLNYFPHAIFSQKFRQGISIGAHMLRGEHRAIISLMMSSKNYDFESADGDDGNSKPNHVAIQATAKENAISTAEILKLTANTRKLVDDINEEILTALATVDETDANDALAKSIDETTLANWLHELCCMIWNRAVSCRVSCLGAFKVLPGDIVERNGSYSFVTREEIASGEVSYQDVLMPVPGHDVSLPQNEVALMYERIFNDLKLPQNMDSWSTSLLKRSISGSYRPMAVRPENFSHEFKLDPSGLRLEISFELPPKSFGSMLVRELCKLELNTPEEAGISMNIGLEQSENTQRSTKVKRTNPKDETSVLHIKPRNRTEEERQLYERKFAPGRKKYTNARSLHQARLMNVIYRDIFPPGRDRLRKLKVNGRLR